MESEKSFSIAGKNLKLDSAADIEPHLEVLRTIQGLEEVHLGGNTLGVEACKALANELKEKKSLKVGESAVRDPTSSALTALPFPLLRRSPTLQTSLLADSSLRSLPP